MSPNLAPGRHKGKNLERWVRARPGRHVLTASHYAAAKLASSINAAVRGAFRSTSPRERGGTTSPRTRRSSQPPELRTLAASCPSGRKNSTVIERIPADDRTDAQPGKLRAGKPVLGEVEHSHIRRQVQVCRVSHVAVRVHVPPTHIELLRVHWVSTFPEEVSPQRTALRAASPLPPTGMVRIGSEVAAISSLVSSINSWISGRASQASW